ncbi:MAG: hypothetical protein EPN93_13490 [Spirochaetes bacterium]|nr:MAG: hypothetical protein EPN93_13490 [Spirochaetota bacterium]
MDLLDKLSKHEVREFVSKSWLTHDAMWFYCTLQECGAETANRLNKSAVRAMAGIEIQRIMKLMGDPRPEIKTFTQLQEIIDTTFRFIKPDFMKLYYGTPEINLFVGGFHECFAHDGLKKFGMIDSYDCGVVARVSTWFETLGVKFEILQDIEKGCLMHKYGKCEIAYRFFLE